MNSNWSYSPETKIWVVTSVTLTFDLWPWPFAWTLPWSNVITPENFMMIRWWEHSQKGVTDGQTDRRTENTIHRAAWSQLKTIGHIYYIKHCASFQSLQWIQTAITVWKRSIRVKISVSCDLEIWWMSLKTIGHLFYATSSFVHHFMAIREFKLKLQSGDAQFG